MKSIECLGLAFVLAAGFVQACGGDSNGDDGGTDATATDAAADTISSDAGNDVTQGDGGACPTYSGSAQFCKDIVAHCGACGSTGLSSCQLANFATICEGTNAAFSQAYVASITSCATICDSDAASACQKAAFADASLTPAQTKVATDYCTFCDGGSACAAQIETSFNLVEISDSLAATIDSKCTPDASAACSPTTFGACVLGNLFAALPNVCADAGK